MYQASFILLLFFFLTSCGSQNKNKEQDADGEHSISAENKGSIEDSVIMTEPIDSLAYIDIILEQLNLKPEDCVERFITEKRLPYDDEKSIVVIPKLSHKEDEDFFSMNPYILVFDHKANKIIYQFYESESWTSDAMVFSGISIDTAPYKLNKATRAFGIMVTYYGSSRVNPYNTTLMSLFVPDGKKLKKVLSDYPVFLFRGEFGFGCQGNSENTKAVLIMSKQETNGYHDIIGKITSEYTVAEKTGDDDFDCNEETSIEVIIDTLRFQNGKYVFKERLN